MDEDELLEGWVDCPNCDGEGVILVPDEDGDEEEIEEDCGWCDGQGIIPEILEHVVHPFAME